MNEGQCYRDQPKPKRTIHVPSTPYENQETIGYAVEDKQQINKL